jgi:biopolymer transport protein ExbD
MFRKKLFDQDDDHVEVSLTPLIDTVMVLLIVFIAATPVIHYSFNISLPHGSHNEYSETKDDLCFAIDQYGRIYNQYKKIISSQDIVLDVNRVLKNNPDIAVVFFADKDATCNILIECMESCKKTNVKYVYCKTKKITL